MGGGCLAGGSGCAIYQLTDQRKRSSVGFWATVILLLLPVLYVLSTGPVAWLHAHHALPGWAFEPIEWAYSPLSALLQGNGPFSSLLLWYLLLWVDPAP